MSSEAAPGLLEGAATTFSDGSVVASVRWAGPPALVQIQSGTLAARGEHIVLVEGNELVAVGDAFRTWPIAAPTRPYEAHGALAPYAGQSQMKQLALLDGGEVLTLNAMSGLQRWRAGAAETAPEQLQRERIAAFGETPDGGLYTLRRVDRREIVVEHRATGAFGEAPRVLGVVKRKDAIVCTAVLHDGSLLVGLFDLHARGRPIDLYRARAEGPALEVLQRHPGTTTSSAARPKRTPRTAIVAVGIHGYLVASSRGAWFVTSNNGPMGPGGPWPPIHVYTLAGDDLAPEGPPLALPRYEGERPASACAVGGLLAIGTYGREGGGVFLTDGRVARRVEGRLQRRWLGAHSIVGSPRGDALLVAMRTGVARCDILAPGDARLASPAYTEQELQPDHLEAAPPEPPTRGRDAWLERVRLVHIVTTISELHFPFYDDGAHGLEGNAAAGRWFAVDGSGNHHVVGWSEAGVVALGFDGDYARVGKAELLEGLPPDVRPLADALHGWKKPVNDIAWFSVKLGEAGGASLTDGLEPFTRDDDDQVCARLKAEHDVSDAQLDLARTLARDTAGKRRALTVAEGEVLAAHPEGRAARPGAVALLRAAAHLADVGVDWSRLPG